MQMDTSPEKSGAVRPGSPGCAEHNRRLEAFGTAVRGLLALHEQQWLAIIDGDQDCCRFDVLIHMANEDKQTAKYAYLRHAEAHGCSDYNGLDKIRA